MRDTPQTLNARGHTDGCPHSWDNPVADCDGTHVDVFCDGCHDWFTEPKILANGTDIAWPSGWTREQAKAWRNKHGLAKQAPPVAH